jgi:hypothetical protein
LPKDIFHQILSSPSLELESEDAFVRILIELGTDYFEFFDYVEVNYLTKEGISLFLDQLTFDDLTQSIWTKLVDRLKQSNGQSLESKRHYRKRIESTIIHDCPDILNEFNNQEWTLLYRGSRDGFRSSTFHAKCDNQSNTLTLIEATNGFIFGGFTPVSWDSSNQYKADNTKKSFLFTLNNPRNSEARKFLVSNTSNAIHCYSSGCPLFGYNHDISVYGSCDTPTSQYTSLGHSYVNDTGIDGKQVFTGEYNFTVKNIEVFQISL